MYDLTYFKLWVKACEEFHRGIYKLTSGKEDGHGVYQTVVEYYAPSQYNILREVFYHLWWHGKQEIVSTNFTELYHIFTQREERIKQYGH